MASGLTNIGGSLSMRKSLAGGFISHAHSQIGGSLSVARSLSGKSDSCTDVNPAEIDTKCILICPKPLLVRPIQSMFSMNELKFNVIRCGDLAPPYVEVL